MLKAILIAGALAIGSSVALAHPGHGDRLANADANKDGMIDKDEFKATRAALFERMDRNSDGVLDDQDKHQRSERRAEHAAKMRAELDSNRDGKVSKDEFTSAPAPFFDQADTDKDGVLSAKELEAAKSRFSERRRDGK
jgi:Ca2+-binding EF-hand superfamily protein